MQSKPEDNSVYKQLIDRYEEREKDLTHLLNITKDKLSKETRAKENLTQQIKTMDQILVNNAKQQKADLLEQTIRENKSEKTNPPIEIREQNKTDSKQR